MARCGVPLGDHSLRRTFQYASVGSPRAPCLRSFLAFFSKVITGYGFSLTGFFMTTKKPPLIAIVGRPNVGKSTLFNRLIGRRHAIVHDEPGVTRDRNYAEGDWAGRAFRLVDTGGYEVEPHSDLFAQMRRQVEEAIREADLVLLVVDGRAGVHPDDREMALKLRRLGKKVFLAVNKIDTAGQEVNLGEFFELGFDPTFPVSAEHGRGVAEWLDEIVGRGGVSPPEKTGAETAPLQQVPKKIRIAIL